MKTKKTLFEWLTTNFSIHMQNDEDFSLKRSFRLNYAKILVILFAFSLTVSISSVAIFRWVDGYYSSELRREKAFRNEIYKLSLAVDTLKTQLAIKDSFIMSFKILLNGGNEIVENEQLKNRAEAPISKQKKVDQIQEAEKKLRDEFENNNDSELFSKKGSSSSKSKSVEGNLAGIYFFPPISGLVSNHYDAKSKHFGIDIIAKENEPIKSVSDGSVIYSGWSYDTGYMLVVQHDEDLISVYKHNASLLKKVGENVKSGEVVAIIGNSGELTSGPHLHFELWFKGQSLNPSDYIMF